MVDEYLECREKVKITCSKCGAEFVVNISQDGDSEDDGLGDTLIAWSCILIFLGFLCLIVILEGISYQFY